MNVKEEKSIIILWDVKCTRFTTEYQVKIEDLDLSLPQVGNGHIRERRWHKDCGTFLCMPHINLFKGKL